MCQWINIVPVVCFYEIVDLLFCRHKQNKKRRFCSNTSRRPLKQLISRSLGCLWLKLLSHHVPTVFKMLFFKTESWNQFTVTSVLWMTNRRFTTEWSFHPEQKQWCSRITCYLSNNQQDMKRLQTARLIRNVNTDVFNTSTCSREFILLEKKKSPSSHHVQVTLLQTYKQKYSLGQKKTFQTLQRIKNFQKIFTNIFFSSHGKLKNSNYSKNNNLASNMKK